MQERQLKGTSEQTAYLEISVHPDSFVKTLGRWWISYVWCAKIPDWSHLWLGHASASRFYSLLTGFHEGGSWDSTRAQDIFTKLRHANVYAPLCSSLRLIICICTQCTSLLRDIVQPISQIRTACTIWNSGPKPFGAPIVVWNIS